MIRLLLLALALAASVDEPGDHTVWEDEDAAREAALEEGDLLVEESRIGAVEESAIGAGGESATETDD